MAACRVNLQDDRLDIVALLPHFKLSRSAAPPSHVLLIPAPTPPGIQPHNLSTMHTHSSFTFDHHPNHDEMKASIKYIPGTLDAITDIVDSHSHRLQQHDCSITTASLVRSFRKAQPDRVPSDPSCSPGPDPAPPGAQPHDPARRGINLQTELDRPNNANNDCMRCVLCLSALEATRKHCNTMYHRVATPKALTTAKR